HGVLICRPGGIECVPQPLPGRVPPDLLQVGRGVLPLGPLTAGRYPGMNGYQRRVAALRDPHRVPQGREATRRPARTDDDPTYAGHDNAPFLRKSADFHETRRTGARLLRQRTSCTPEADPCAGHAPTHRIRATAG